jgi:hypothetical protein
MRNISIVVARADKTLRKSNYGLVFILFISCFKLFYSVGIWRAIEFSSGRQGITQVDATFCGWSCSSRYGSKLDMKMFQILFPKMTGSHNNVEQDLHIENVLMEPHKRRGRLVFEHPSVFTHSLTVSTLEEKMDNAIWKWNRQNRVNKWLELDDFQRIS